MHRALILCLLCSLAQAQAIKSGSGTVMLSSGGGVIWHPAIPAVNSVAANWSNAGTVLIGGIPNRTTQCGSTLTPSGGDDFTQIQNAINACTAGDYVLLNGAFKVNMADLPIQISTGISLRGAGSCNGTTGGALGAAYCETSISVANGALTYTGGDCGTDTSHEVACPSGGPGMILIAPFSPYYGYSWEQCGNAGSDSGSNCGATPLAADAPQGATTVQVTSTANFTVGSWVLIDEASGAGFVADPMSAYSGYGGSIWAALDWLSSSSSPATGRVVWSKAQNSSWDFTTSQYPYQANDPGCWFSYCDRVTNEIHKVTAIGGGPCPGTNCTVTFDDPLTVAFRVSGTIPITASISGTTLTLTSGSGLAKGQLIVAAPGAVTAIKDGTYITGGSGTSWTVSISQTVGSEAMQSAAHGAHIYARLYGNQSGTGTPISFLTEAGVENISLLRGVTGGVEMEMCAYCWLKNVDVGYWYGGGVDVQYSVRSELNTVYIHHCANSTNNGSEYPFALDLGSTEILLTNSITNFAGKGMVARAAGGGSVISYNYIDDSMYDKYSDIGDYWIEQGANASHWSGNHHVLFEGNWADNLDSDNTHGNATYITFFRNYAPGYRTTFIDPSCSLTVNDFAGIAYQSGCTANGPGPLRAAGPQSYNYWFAFVGNVLGASNTTTANGWSYEGDWNGSRMFALGWNAGNGGQDPNLDGSTGSYIFIHGNYDYVNGAIHASVAGYTPAAALPVSLYLSSAPAFFIGASCKYPWPWVTPVKSPYTQLNSCSGSGLPALARWNAGTPFIQP